MGNNRSQRSFVVQGSPVEFILVGAKGSHDGVLVSSEGPQLDLVGFAASQLTETYQSPRSILLSLFDSTRHMNGVSSFSLDNLPVEMLETKPGKAIGLEHLDERKSGYRLYWVGLCSESALREIREVFNLYAADLKYGIEAGDIEQIEWTLAPTLLRCSTANARRKRSRRIRNYFLALSVLLYTIALLFFFARNLFGF